MNRTAEQFSDYRDEVMRTTTGNRTLPVSETVLKMLTSIPALEALFNSLGSGCANADELKKSTDNLWSKFEHVRLTLAATQRLTKVVQAAQAARQKSHAQAQEQRVKALQRAQAAAAKALSGKSAESQASLLPSGEAGGRTWFDLDFS